MAEPYFSDDTTTLYLGDAAQTLALLPAGLVDCCVTSPPYFGLRDYGVEGQLGLEPSPAEYVAALVAVLEQVKRVLADDGTLWLNLGDSYSSRSGGAPQSGNIVTNGGERFRRPRAQDFIPAKNLLGMPWRVAFALQDAGWFLRNDIIWAKTNGMPTSVADRFASKHEHIFLFSREPHYWFDVDAVRVPHAESSLTRFAAGLNPQTHPTALRVGGARDGIPVGHVPSHGANPGDVWVINSQPFTEAHFAVMPVELAERCIQAGCKPGGTVLDPFSGSGTTGLAAARHGRRYVGIDVNREYLDLSLRTRLAQPGFDFAGRSTTEGTRALAMTYDEQKSAREKTPWGQFQLRPTHLKTGRQSGSPNSRQRREAEERAARWAKITGSTPDPPVAEPVPVSPNPTEVI